MLLSMKPFSFPAYCRKRKIAYTDLAGALGISRSYACQLRSGQKPITATIAYAIQAAYGIPVNHLLEGRYRV